MRTSPSARLLFAFGLAGLAACSSTDEHTGERYAMHADDYPERVTLTWNGDPATSFVANWHTRAETEAQAQFAKADPSPNFQDYAQTVEGRTETVAAVSNSGYFHHARFGGLEPDTLYAYRVGDGDTWSSWYHHRTAAKEPQPFTFVYLGDAQNAILSLWSRAIRGAFADAAEARFVIHAGDLVNRADRNQEWAEWHEAAGWIFAMVPSVATPGNHEYTKLGGGKSRLSHFWRPTFCFPENGPPGYEETVYHLDFQGMRLISLNSMAPLEPQVEWVEGALANNPNHWTVVTLHHPLYATKAKRDNHKLRKALAPVFARHKVDLVLQGHDHAYGRGQNLPVGERAEESGTVYVVSVSGPKMYDADHSHDWTTRKAENTQLYQVIEVEAERLRYRAKTVTGQVYDAFDLIKPAGQPSKLVEVEPEVEARTFQNTLLRKE